MSSGSPPSNERVAWDAVMTDIVDYVREYPVESPLAYTTARHCLIDTLGCGLAALSFPACSRLLGPLAPGTRVVHGARVPGTRFELDPVQAAFNIGAMVRWLDFNDTWLAAEWGHPSDNLGGILATADWLSRNAEALRRPPLTMRDVLVSMIKAHEIQGCLALENAFNRVGLDHVVLVKVASTAVVAHLLGLDRERMLNAVSLAWVDGQALRTYRHAPNTGSRKSWAAGDATSRAVRLALMAATGEMGYPSALTAPTWGFYDVSFGGQPFRFQRPYGSYVMENVLFKISYPAEFHGQTAVEAAMQVHARMRAAGRRSEDIERITLRTQQACLRIIDKPGPLHNPADRDHCVQYMVAIALIFGRLVAEDYEDDVAADPRIDPLRARIACVEEPRFTADYLDPDKRSIANALHVTFKDGTTLEETVEYPLGHARRRAEGIPLLEDKFRRHLAGLFPTVQQRRILDASLDPVVLEAMPVHEYVDLYVA
ncbi:MULTISPECIES: bifunctional 2-methylcitrate dehydratase/aconitate hydratase [Stenotrophomonas]|jgi:2-methylcitrate dehydratase|uniref:2-methylcitrate dehydratase n=3 Tax=Stenotrophomonas TaxID=40323 RepID=A0A4S2D9D2_STEMA|nr:MULTISPECIES: bifunctional 2-methylcitrate dehydratase/aconitate hydratase [Stenotrophomonas]TGY37273.1 bifunctional 2-methylcitrate dehydratase/aconitate hydratase [Stenotrophomonas maltophilia]